MQTQSMTAQGCAIERCGEPVRFILVDRDVTQRPYTVRTSCFQHQAEVARLAGPASLALDFGDRLYPARIGWLFNGGTQCESCGEPDDVAAVAIRAGDAWMCEPPPCRHCGLQLAVRLEIERPSVVDPVTGREAIAVDGWYGAPSAGALARCTSCQYAGVGWFVGAGERLSHCHQAPIEFVTVRRPEDTARPVEKRAEGHEEPGSELASALRNTLAKAEAGERPAVVGHAHRDAIHSGWLEPFRDGYALFFAPSGEWVEVLQPQDGAPIGALVRAVDEWRAEVYGDDRLGLFPDVASGAEAIINRCDADETARERATEQ